MKELAEMLAARVVDDDAPTAPHPPHPDTWSLDQFVLSAAGDPPRLVCEPASAFLSCDECDGGVIHRVRDDGLSFCADCRCRVPHKIAARVSAIGLPAKARRQRFADLDWSRVVDLEGRALRDRLRSWLTAWDADAPGLLLYGPTGTGKSHVAAACALWLCVARGATVRHVDWRDHFGRYAAASRTAPADARDMVAALMAPDVLVIDEVTHQNTWAREHFEHVIHHRVELRGGSTIITSNLDPTPGAPAAVSMVDALGDRTASRLSPLTALGMGGDDYRRQK